MIQSTRWPGAKAIVYNNQFTNIYMGDGVKGFEDGVPVYPLVPDMMKEYAGEEGDMNVLVEGVDPTVEEEHVNEEELQEKLEVAEEEE
jgi:Radial spokehead-like protein